MCRRDYDVVLMNPPFGEASRASRAYLYASVPSCSQDLFAGFVERFALKLDHGGRLGAITSRLALSKDLLESWRRRFMLGGDSSLVAVADLGYGVLDAMVEAAGYVIARAPRDAEVDFMAALNTVSKDEAVLGVVDSIARGAAHPGHYRHALVEFDKLPSAIVAYSSSRGWLRRFASTNRLADAMTAKKGLETGDDFRFLRLAHEVPAGEFGGSGPWLPYSKGGPYRPWSDDLHLAFKRSSMSLARRTSNADLYGRPGLTYSERTTSSFAVRVMPAGALFSPKGPGVFGDSLWGLLGLLNSWVVNFYVELLVGGGDYSARGTAARDFAPSLLEAIPAPDDLSGLLRDLGPLTKDLCARLGAGAVDETHPSQVSLPSPAISIAEAAKGRYQLYAEELPTLYGLVRRIEALVEDAYHLGPSELAEGTAVVGRPFASGAVDPTSAGRALRDAFGSRTIEDDDDVRSSRAEMKLSHCIDHHLELASARIRANPVDLAPFREELGLIPEGSVRAEAAFVVSYAVGCAFGRWDIRYALDPSTAPIRDDPFASVPTCPPGMLKALDGSPASAETISTSHYPVSVSWAGILIDDPSADGNPHADDMAKAVREVLRVLWPGAGDLAADAIETELCEILGFTSLQDYLRRPSGFFRDHLSQYSRSRRQAPIYWPLSTTSGSYTLWIYYPRLSDDLLYRAVTDYLDPKLTEIERRVGELNAHLSAPLARDAAQLRGQLDELRIFRGELTDLRAELLRVAALPYRPNLDDGVLISAAPLYRLFRLPKWRADLKVCWDKLAAGEYDWAHVAFTSWPDRVREACRHDRSIAIAHGLEDLFAGSIPGMTRSGSRQPLAAEDGTD